MVKKAPQKPLEVEHHVKHLEDKIAALEARLSEEMSKAQKYLKCFVSPRVALQYLT